MSTKQERENEYLDSLGLNVIDGKTIIKYANGTLTEDGFIRDESFNDSKKGMCHWVSDDMSMKMEDLNAFLDLIINSKYLSDGLLWGIAVNTWPVISQQLYDTEFPTPIVFFMGEPNTFKTSIARMFLTTGRYKRGKFDIYQVDAFDSPANFKKQLRGFQSSLVLLDDLHEVTGYGSKDKMQGNIDTICRKFYDYRNDSSLLMTSENNVNLKFTKSFLQRVVWVNFSSEIDKETEEKERYFEYKASRSKDILRILTEYQIFLLKQINDEQITSEHINQRRKTERDIISSKDSNKTNRQIDAQVLFEFSLSKFYEFCSKFDVSEERLNSLFQEIQNTKKRTLSESEYNFYIMTFEQRVYHCLKFIGSRSNFLVTKAKKGEICVNFEQKSFEDRKEDKNSDPSINNAVEDILNQVYEDCIRSNHKKDQTDYVFDIIDYDNICAKEYESSSNYDNYINKAKNNCYYCCFEYKYGRNYCKSSIHSHKLCKNKKIEERYWPASLYLDKDLKRKAILIEDLKEVPFFNEYSLDEHCSLLIVSAELFIDAIRDIYDGECEKYNIHPIPKLTSNQILNALNKLGIIGYKKIPYSKKNDDQTYVKNNYKFDFPGEKAYILKLPDEIYNAISSNIEKIVDSRDKEKEMKIFNKFGRENGKKLYELFYHFDEIRFRPTT